LLIEAGADVDAQNKWEWTALMRTLEARDLEVVKLLIEQGADVRCRTSLELQH